MILPQTYAVTIFLMVFSMLCLGSWASTYKASRWRFELYYFDFSFGLLVAAAILAFTVGSMGFDGFTFLDDMLHAGKRQWFFAFTAGVVFNLANMLLMAAIAVAGMTVAFPVSAGLALIAGVVIGRFQQPTGNPLMAFGGCVLVFVAILVAGAAYRFINEIRHEAKARAGKSKSTKRPVAVKGVVLSLLSGALMAGCYPLLAKAKEGEAGLGPYSVAMIFAGGAFLSTFVFNLFFMNLPIEGDPVDFMEYFQSSPRAHGLAVLGGVIWCLGIVAALVAASAENVRIVPSLSYGLSQAPALIAVLWGALVWKEFRDGDARTKSLVALMFILFTVGVTLVSLAQAFARRA
ncbi:MAG: multidrug DMT transporter permease [Bryobacteraceae bacterium]|jgi:glucose uptake protein